MTGNLDDLRDRLLHGNMGGVVADFEAAVRADALAPIRRLLDQARDPA